MLIAVAAVGVVMLLAGLWWAYPPAALVALGAGLVWLALYWDFDEEEEEWTDG